MTTPENDRIHGWRDIAAYLSRDERTAKRWEKQRGLPVRRIPGEGRANVYASRRELEIWLQGAASAGEAMLLVDERVEMTEQGALLGQPTAAATEETPGLPPRTESSMSDAVASSCPHRVHRPFRPSEHISLLVSVSGLAVLLIAATMQFFHVGPLVSPMFASETTLPSPKAHIPLTEVDQLYLEGVYLTEKRTPAALLQARVVFENAIAKDPEYAPSYGGLAETYLLLREYATMPHEDAYRAAKSAAEQALRLDPNLAEPHAVLGFIEFFSEWKPVEAEQEFAMATQLEPGNALAHHWYGSMLTHQGRYREALTELNIAQHLRPTSTAILASKALALAYGGDKAEALRLLHSVEDTALDAPVVHRDLAYLSMLAPRDPEMYLREMKRFSEMRSDDPAVKLLRKATDAYRQQGESGMWTAMLREERTRHPDRAHPTYRIAQAEAQLGREQEALDDLRQLAVQKDALLIGLILDPALQPLRKDTAFERIVENVGLSLPAIAAR